MRIFLAGATGVIGRQLLPILVEDGHEVTGMTRSEERAEAIRATGASASICDALEKENLVRAVVAARPEVIVHQLTRIPKRLDPRKIKSQLEPTNRLRSEGTANLVMASQAARASRLVAQSIAFAYPPRSEGLSTEEDPLFPDPPSAFGETLGAVKTLERTVLAATGLESLVLRYGYFYGPGTIYAPDGSFAEDVRRRRVPILGDGGGVFSFIHTEDAARATVAAVTRGEPGVYNIVDDDPAPVREWLPIYADLLGAPRPFPVARWIGRLAAGRYITYMMTEQGGVSNAKAKQSLGWSPTYPSWREGFQAELASAQA